MLSSTPFDSSADSAGAWCTQPCVEDNILLKSTLIGKAVQLGDTNVRSDIVRLA